MVGCSWPDGFLDALGISGVSGAVAREASAAWLDGCLLGMVDLEEPGSLQREMDSTLASMWGSPAHVVKLARAKPQHMPQDSRMVTLWASTANKDRSLPGQGSPLQNAFLVNGFTTDESTFFRSMLH